MYLYGRGHAARQASRMVLNSHDAYEAGRSGSVGNAISTVLVVSPSAAAVCLHTNSPQGSTPLNAPYCFSAPTAPVGQSTHQAVKVVPMSPRMLMMRK